MVRTAGGPTRIPGSEGLSLWHATEGQVANAGVYLRATLTFWLVVPRGYALYRYLVTVNHRYELTDQRLLVRGGILVKTVELLELYRVKDVHVTGTLLQSLFGRGRVVVLSTDATAPSLTLNAVPNPDAVPIGVYGPLISKRTPCRP